MPVKFSILRLAQVSGGLLQSFSASQSWRLYAVVHNCSQISPYKYGTVQNYHRTCAHTRLRAVLPSDTKDTPAFGGDPRGQTHRAMIVKPGFRQAFHLHPLCKQRVAVTVCLLLGLCLQSFNLHAALLFRSLEQVNGQLRWSAIKSYNNPSDTAYAQVSANGAAAPAEEVRVFLSGEITYADVDAATVMEGLLRSGKQKISGNSVWFASNGGDIDVGMELGRRLRRLGIFTLIGKNDRCLSACVFAFMGGERRSVEGQLGIHRPYFLFTQDADRQAKFRYLQKVLKAYIAEMDFPDSLYEAVMLVPPESMEILGPADLKRFYLEGISPSTEDMVDAASARRLNLSMFQYLKRKAAAPACAFFDAGEGRCEGRVLAAVTSGGAADDPENMQASNTAETVRADASPSAVRVRSGKPAEADSRDPI